MIIFLKKSSRKNKKFMTIVDNKTVHFGQQGASDYTINKDPQRKRLYINRHRSNENWKKTGILTAGFWSRWLLWNETTISKSILSIEKKFNVKITRT
tara:strand:+ start:365 stop:655 length:291 start_codon:yes stop_codon:yes gene_type:complete